MSLSFVNDLQAQVEKLEKEILEAEAVGRDSGGDRLALSHLRDLVEHLRGKDVRHRESGATVLGR
jgi:hypothetical protein